MSALRHVEHCISRQQAHRSLNAFISISDAASLRASAAVAQQGPDAGVLQGVTISLKDNISTSSLPTTCASKALSNYTPPVQSTVAYLLDRTGAIMIGKTNMDEFGMGSHSRTSHSGPVLSPFKRNRDLSKAGAREEELSPGGSSGGAAVAVATGQCAVSIGTDTGGSVRLPAAWTGTVGFKPSYGRISRWGVVDYANSLDTVGIIAKTVDDCEKVFSVLDKEDEKDPTCLARSTRARVEEAMQRRGKRRSGLRVGVPVEYNVAGMQEEVKAAWRGAVERLQQQGHDVVPVSLPSTRMALGAYYILAPAEASSNLARYDGVRYGFRADGPDEVPATPSAPSSPASKHTEADGNSSAIPARADSSVLYARTRAEAFGAEVQRRILLGTYSLSSTAIDNYFLQAQRVRRLIQTEFDAAFTMHHPLLDHAETDRGVQSVDVLLAPTAPTLPPSMEQVAAQSAVEKYLGDVFTVPASLAGLPALNVPVPLKGSQRADDKDGWAVDSAGMQIIGQYGDDRRVLESGRMLHQLYNES